MVVQLCVITGNDDMTIGSGSSSSSSSSSSSRVVAIAV